MHNYRILVEHTNGQSVAHFCKRGLYSDPIDGLPSVVTADSIELAEVAIWDMIEKMAVNPPTCPDCERGNIRGNWAEDIMVTAIPE